jgi:H+-transporting ATPase
MELRKTVEYKQVTPEETIRLLETSMSGLTESEAEVRIQKFGYNEVVEKKRNPVIDFLSRYWGPMPWLLELIIVLSYFLGHYLEVAIVFVLLTLNVVIGFLHTHGSQKALELLKSKLAVSTRMLRDERWVTRNAREIVPGDVVVLGIGDLVPADAKLLTDDQISVDQSALTGESLPVGLRSSDIIYSGSIVKRGETKAVVLNTGVKTNFGRTVELVKLAKPKSHQEEIMLALVKYLMYASVVAVILVAIDAMLMRIDILSILAIVLTFLLGAVPVALPAVLAVLLATGAIELVKKGVLVTRLNSIEDAASVEVLCLDKTGTITQNKLSVSDPVPFSGFDKNDVATIASLASKEESKDVIDSAVIEYAKTLDTRSEYEQVSFTPFEPATKRSEAIVEGRGGRFRVVKGAPQIVMSLCKQTNDDTQLQANAKLEELSRKGYRTLAVARSEGEDLSNLRLVGLLPLADPPRPDSRTMIEELKTLGVGPKMLTGDNIAIANEIAGEVSIGNRICRMSDIRNLDEIEQERVIEECDGFAEIYPEDKYKIVKLLQSNGYIVGMTGDGVNDSPALKQAEVGIAVHNSTDVAKASSSIILTEPGTRQIINAITTSRQIYQRALTWVINKVTKVIQFIGLLVLGFFWLHQVLLSVLGMVLLVFANDFVTMSLATDRVKHTSNPNIWNLKNVTLASLIIGNLLVAEGVIAVYVAVNYYSLEWRALQTFVLLLLVFTSQFRVLVVRERKRFWSSRPGNALLLSTIATIIGFALLGIYGIIIPQISMYQVFFALGFSGLFTFGIDFPKYYLFRKFRL